MIGVGGLCEVGLMAAVARCGERRVVVVYMALRAGHGSVRAGERERCVVVVECSARPVGCAVAGGAGGRKASADVIRIRGAGVVSLMAGVTIGRDGCVVVVGVAAGSRHSDVGAGERERSLVVIERGARPGRSVVAGGAGGRKARCDVIRIRGAGVVSLVAGVTIGRNGCVVVVGVAGCARHSDVGAGERKCSSVVIECGWRPGRRVVACCTCGRKASCRVIGVGGSGVVGFMAGVAVRWNGCVVVVGVARRARHSDMRTGEGEGTGGVIEGRRIPAGGGVAERAIRREGGGDVIRICCSSEVALVA